jgi:starch phosphorylase
MAHNSRAVCEQDAEIREAIALLFSGHFNPNEPAIFAPIRAGLLDQGDPFGNLADLRSYVDAQDRVDALYRQPDAWARKAILNVARSGKFSSDRAIAEYARRIWAVEPCPTESAPPEND